MNEKQLWFGAFAIGLAPIISITLGVWLADMTCEYVEEWFGGQHCRSE